jgi:hypothetical protein
MFHTPVTGAYIIATEKEAGSQLFKARFSTLNRYAPTLQVFQARNVAKDGITYPLTLRTKLTTTTKSKHCVADISSAGELGCADSHVTLWRRAAAHPNPEGWTLIFEADVRPNILVLPSALPSWSTSEKGGDCSACLILLGYEFLKAQFDNRSVGTGFVLKTKASQFYGTHAYAVRNKHAAALLAACLPLDMQIDTSIDVAHRHSRIPPIWLASRRLFRQPMGAINIHKIHLKAFLPTNTTALFFTIVLPWAVVIALAITTAVLAARQR